jgi:hypothetical protein
MLPYLQGRDKGIGLSPSFSPPAEPRIPWILAGGPGRPFFPYQGVPPMRVAIYARVSTDDKGQDPENQLRELRAWCVNSGHTITIFRTT